MRIPRSADGDTVLFEHCFQHPQARANRELEQLGPGIDEQIDQQALINRRTVPLIYPCVEIAEHLFAARGRNEQAHDFLDRLRWNSSHQPTCLPQPLPHSFDQSLPKTCVTASQIRLAVAEDIYFFAAQFPLIWAQK